MVTAVRMHTFLVTLPVACSAAEFVEAVAAEQQHAAELVREGAWDADAAVPVSDEAAYRLAVLTVARDLRRYPQVVRLEGRNDQVLVTLNAEAGARDAFAAQAAELGATAETVSAGSFPAEPYADRIVLYPPRQVDWCAGCGCGRHEGRDRCLQCGHGVFFATVHNMVCLTMLDVPTAHAINQHAELDHDPRCSSVQTGQALLCDCDAVEREWKRIVASCAPVSA